MGVIAELFNPSVSAEAGPLDDSWYQPIGFADNTTGELVSPDTAMRLATVYACVRILAESVASLPLVIYKRRKSGGKDVASDHWLFDLVHSVPNGQQTSFGWREMCQGHLCLRGNAYSVLDWHRGRVERIIPINPDRVTVKVTPDKKIEYWVKDTQTGQQDLYWPAEMLHVPGLSFDGITGISPIRYTARGLGLSMAAEKFGARFFKNGAKASGVVIYPGPLTATGQKNLRESITAHIGGDNVHSPLVLEEDAKWEQLTVNPDDAQFLETRKFQDIDICKIFGVPPHLIGILDKATFNNIEHLSIDFVRYSLRSWLVRWEQVINKQLLDGGKTYFSKFKVEGLLRGDIRSRYIAYSKGIGDGWLTRAEARDWEDLNPIEGLEEPLVPMNMTTADQVGKESEQGQNSELRSLVIEDAAARIASAEIKAIAARIEYADGDRERFTDWLRDFYDKQVGYINRNVAMVARVTGADVESAPTAIVRSGVSQFETENRAAAAFAAFQAEREQQIADILQGVYHETLSGNH
jgi:HK97 family phage portal protein